MSFALQEAAALLPQLQASASASSDAEAAKGRAVLQRLKLLMTEFPSASASAPAAASDAEAALSCEILESGAVLALRAADLPAFERNAAMLAPLYSLRRARAGAPAAESAAQAAARQRIQGLALMHLLVSARLAEFHSAVERISPADRACIPVAFPLALEAQLSEGQYNRILAASTQALPSPLFAPFMQRLVGTVRDDFAECAASAYTSLGVEAAQRMLLLDSPAALAAYAAEKDWRINNGVITFPAAGGAAGFGATSPGRGGGVGGDGAKPGIDAFGLMGEVIGFATTIERIV